MGAECVWERRVDLSQKRILVGISGGIAAYKACDLVRRLKDAGAEVRVMMSAHALEFVSAMTLQALSGEAVRVELFAQEEEHAMSHIALARWADWVIIAPATANTVAKMSHGMADDLLSTVCLATDKPILLCPAMNRQMWQNEATQQNIAQLVERGIRVLGPASGMQACGETGPGRMCEVIDILNYLKQQQPQGCLAKKRVLITAGPTREAIDPVRYLSNHSSGKMGYALAQAARDAGAEVTLITGPTSLTKPGVRQVIEVESAVHMHQAVMKCLNETDIMIAAAAVSDYRVKNKACIKMKKTGRNLALELTQNPDIVADVAASGKVPVVVAFAAETHDLIQHARLKLQQKRVSMVVANLVGDGKVFNQNENAVTVISEQEKITLDAAPKAQIATQLIEIIGQYYRRGNHETSDTIKNSQS